MPRALPLALILAAAIGLIPWSAHAQIYRWVDRAGVAHFADGLDAVPEQYRGAATSLGMRNLPQAPPARDTGAAAGRPTGGATIRYTPGQRIMVDVSVNGSGSARLLLDTGADRTLISPRALAAAGVSLTRPVATGELIGVTGTDRLTYVMVDSLEVAGARVGRMPVGAYEVAQTEGDGLLGRDFLDRFNVTIDAASGVVTLAPK